MMCEHSDLANMLTLHKQAARAVDQGMETYEIEQISPPAAEA